jgi:hypothetical protein
MLAEDIFTIMTFVLDTGAPKMYISQLAKPLLCAYTILGADEELGIEYVRFFGRKYRVENTPEGHAPANILGVKLLCRWGLTLHDEPTFGFEFAKDFDYLEA